MQTILLLAEKPDQAKKYANALGTPKKADTGWDVYSDNYLPRFLSVLRLDTWLNGLTPGLILKIGKA